MKGTRRQMWHRKLPRPGWAVVMLPFLMLVFPAAAQVTARQDEVGRQILKWHGEGTAAGLTGFYYENRDGGHSPFDTRLWPQVQTYQPTASEKEGGRDRGPASQVRPFPLLGNSSMSAPPDKGGSLPRIYMGSSQGFEFLNAQYLGNNLFFYPEHMDHDPGWNGRGGWGDLYPANVPFVVISQGSSYTDQPFLQAFFSAAASFPPETQRVLLRNRMLAPTLQAVFRRSNRVVRKEEDYFTGAAHPPVFDGANLDEARMVQEAHDMLPPLIPPVAILEVVEEPVVTAGKDFFELDAVKDEKLGTVPGAVARVFRGAAGERQWVFGARKSADLMRRTLRYRWVLLQGDAEKVRIEPQGDGGTAKVSVAWHPRIFGAGGMASHRVDVGLFVGNGVSWSAPAIISLAHPANETRFYGPDGRIQEIDYRTGNPDPGLPPADDLRWLTFGNKVGDATARQAVRRLAGHLPTAVIQNLKQMSAELAPAQEAWRKLSANENTKSQAEAALQKLKGELKSRLTAPQADGETLSGAVEKAVLAFASEDDLWKMSPAERDAWLQNSGKPGAGAAVREALQKLLDYQVLRQLDGGQLVATWSEAGPSIRHYLREYHFTLLSELLLPDFLERAPGPAFADARVSMPKAWRDVYLYDKQGLCQGWTRYSHGRSYEFDLEGWLLPQGRGGRSVSVKYVRDETTGTLMFVPR